MVVHLGAIGIGFAIGAPYAVLNPTEYVSCIRHLIDQYSGGNRPHGLHDGSIFDRLRRSTGYLSYAIGLSVFLLAAIGAARLYADRRYSMLALMVGICLSGVYLLQSRTFCERNLSHALPVLFVLSGVGIREIGWQVARGRHVAAVVAAVFLAIVVAWPSAMATKHVTSASSRRALAKRI